MADPAAAILERAGTPDEPDDERAIEPSALRRCVSSSAFGVFLVDVALIVLFTALSPGHVFGTWDNAQALMLNTSEILVLGLALTLMLSATVIDLSLGANLVLSSVVGAQVLVHTGAASELGVSTGSYVPEIALAVAGCLLVGAIFGAVNGVVIEYLHVNSIIATLGTLGIGTGAALIIAGGSDIGGLPVSMQTGFALRTVLGVPLPVVAALLIAAALWYCLARTRYGLRTLAIGSNRLAVERVGLRPSLHVISLTMVGGLLAGFAGFIDIARFGATNVGGHSLDALAAATAVVVGGTGLQGGRASVMGTIWGAALGAILLNGLVVVGVQPYYQQVATGTVLIAAVSIDYFRRRGPR